VDDALVTRELVRQLQAWMTGRQQDVAKAALAVDREAPFDGVDAAGAPSVSAAGWPS